MSGRRHLFLFWILFQSYTGFAQDASTDRTSVRRFSLTRATSEITIDGRMDEQDAPDSAFLLAYSLAKRAYHFEGASHA